MIGEMNMEIKKDIHGEFNEKSLEFYEHGILLPSSN